MFKFTFKKISFCYAIVDSLKCIVQLYCQYHFSFSQHFCSYGPLLLGRVGRLSSCVHFLSMGDHWCFACQCAYKFLLTCRRSKYALQLHDINSNMLYNYMTSTLFIVYNNHDFNFIQSSAFLQI